MPTFGNCFSSIPKRWLISGLGFFGFFNAYTLRICLSIAITKMTVPHNHTKEFIDDTCPDFEVTNSSTNQTTISGGTFEWSEYTQGIILSSFYWGYVITHIPGGLLSERYGSKCVMGLGILFTSILTVVTPICTQLGSANGLILIRFLMGLGEGVIQPSMSCLLARWIPAEERSLIGSIVYSGIRFGILVSSIISGLIIGKNNDWPSIFYLFGGIGILWYVFWLYLCYDDPNDHPFITSKEKSYLRETMKICNNNTKERKPFPWKYALRSKAFIAVIVMQAGQDCSNYTIMSDLPKYMSGVLKLPVQSTGYASSMHNISSWLFCMLMSWISDVFIAKGLISRTNVRKVNTSISSLGPGVMLVLATYVGCDVILAVSLITIGLTMSGCAIPGLKVNVLDLSPNHAGTLMGISNGIGAFMGILAPYCVGILAPNQTVSEWKLIFWIIFVIYFIATVNFIIFASGDVQNWDNPSFAEKLEGKADSAVNEDTNFLSGNVRDESKNNNQIEL